jgi:hypothetical protein
VFHIEITPARITCTVDGNGLLVPGGETGVMAAQLRYAVKLVLQRWWPAHTTEIQTRIGYGQVAVEITGDSLAIHDGEAGLLEHQLHNALELVLQRWWVRGVEATT